MNKMIALLMVGFSSSIALADEPGAGNERKDTIAYECKFEGKKSCSNCGDKKLECWSEGLLCDETDRDEYKRCRNSEDPLAIKCSDGTRLFTRDAAVRIDNGTLWVNADDKYTIATIRVEDFIKDRGDDYEFRRRADLLISTEYGKAERIDGVCKFEKKHGGYPDL